MSSFRSDAIGESDSGSGLGVIRSICGSALGFASDAGPCMCCGCLPDGSAYRFDRSFMWAPNIRNPINAPAEPDVTLNAYFEEISASIDLTGDDPKSPSNWRVTCMIEDAHFVGDPDQIINQLAVDRSYDGHCGFGLDYRDVDPAASWEPAGAPGPVANRTPIDRSVSDSYVLIDRELDFTDGSQPAGDRYVRFDDQGSSASPVDLPIKRLVYHEQWRVIADSRGHHSDREGMISRMRGQASYEAGIDLYQPCVLVECKLIVSHVEYDVASYTTAQHDFHAANADIVGTLVGNIDQQSPYNPVSCQLAINSDAMYHDYVDGMQATVEYSGMVLMAATHRAYLISGSTRSEVFIGEYSTDAMTGGDGYPVGSASSNVFNSINSPSFTRTAIFQADELLMTLTKDNALWSRNLSYDIDDDGGSPQQVTRMSERVLVRSLTLGLHIPMIRSAERVCMISQVDGWSPGIDQPGNGEDNDLVVSVYRRCGSVCNDDVFAPHVDPSPSSPVILIGSTGSEQVHHWVGQTIIETPNDDYHPDPTYKTDASSQCFNFAIAVPCDPIVGAPPILFAKGSSYIDGGTVQVTFDDDIDLRYTMIPYSVHSDLHAPELDWVDESCVDDGTDRRIATACVPGTIPAQYPAWVSYDRNLMPEGSTTYIVSVATAGDKGPVIVDVPYQITSTPTQAEITDGVFSGDSCPPLMMVVCRCDDETIKRVIDPSLLEPDAMTVLIDGERYTMTSEVSTDDPVAFESSDQLCSGDWYKTRSCSGEPRDIPYRVSRNMEPGEGVVHYVHTRIGPNGGLCRTLIQLQPTDEQAPEPDQPVFAFQIQGNCTGQTLELGDCFRQVDPPIDPTDGPFLRTGGSDSKGAPPPPNPMDAVYASQYAQQLGCVSCGG